MKNLLTIIVLLTFSTTFSQIEFDEKNYNKTLHFKNIIDANQLSMIHKPNNPLIEIKDLQLIDLKNNSEGKFSLNKENENIFIEKNDVSNLIIDKNHKDIKTNNQLISNTKREFIKEVIEEKFEEEMYNSILFNEALTYGDKNLEFYRNYKIAENKLIITYPINSEIEIQIGKDIYPYLNKILKTELDNTLQNSLNLLVVNF